METVQFDMFTDSDANIFQKKNIEPIRVACNA